MKCSVCGSAYRNGPGSPCANCGHIDNPEDARKIVGLDGELHEVENIAVLDKDLQNDAARKAEKVADVRADLVKAEVDAGEARRLATENSDAVAQVGQGVELQRATRKVSGEDADVGTPKPGKKTT